MSGFDLAGRRVWVAGHRGMVGRAVVRRLATEECEVLTTDRERIDFREQARVRAWTAAARPDVVIVAAAKVGGILANNSYPADFIYDNLMIEANIIQAAKEAGVGKLVFLGSSCIYPRMAAQPIVESALLSGPLEPTNEWYAVAKIAGIKLCQAYRRQYGCDFISAMPTNLFGPYDNFDLLSSHVMPALMRKIHDAKINGVREIEIWGSGTPRREFLHVDDCADAIVHLAKTYSDEEHVNIGSGEDLMIAGLASKLADVIGWTGAFVYDRSKPDGTPRKQLDISKLKSLGWSPRFSLEAGIRQTYQWFLEHQAQPASSAA